MASRNETAESVADFIVQDIMSAVFEVVAPTPVPMYELLVVIVKEVEDIVAGVPVVNPTMHNPGDIIMNIAKAIERASRVNDESWEWDGVHDVLACCLALRDTPSEEVIRWIERGFIGSRFASVDLWASVYEYLCLFDDIPDTPHAA